MPGPGSNLSRFDWKKFGQRLPMPGETPIPREVAVPALSQSVLPAPRPTNIYADEAIQKGAPPRLPILVGQNTPRGISGSGTIDDLMAKRNAQLMGADKFPSSKIEQTDQGYVIGPPKKTSRLNAFIRGMGRGAEAGSVAGAGGAAGGGLLGGITGAIDPESVDRAARMESVGRTEHQIGTTLGIQKEQAGINKDNAAAIAAMAQGNVALMYPNTRAREVVLPNGQKATVNQTPGGGWEVSQVGSGTSAVPAMGPVPKTYTVDGIEGLNPEQAISAQQRQGNTDLQTQEFQYKQQKDATDNDIKRAEAAGEAGSYEESLNTYLGAERSYRELIGTAQKHVSDIDAAIQKETDETAKSLLVERRKEAVDELKQLNKNAEDAATGAREVQVRLGTARGKAKAYNRPKPTPAGKSSGLFEKY